MKCDMDWAGGPPPSRKHFLHRVVTRPLIIFVVQPIVGLPLYENQGHGWQGGSAMIAKWLGLAASVGLGFFGDASTARSQNFLYSNGQYSTLPINGDLTGINNSGEIVGTGSGTVGSFSYSNGTYTPIIVPGSNYTNAIGINNLDQIVGYYDLPSPSESVAFGFIYSNGVYTTTINVPGSGISGFSAYTLAYAINDSGVVVGTYIASDRPYGFMYSDGNYTTLDYPGSQATSVNGINDLVVKIRRKSLPHFQ
jgi:probable HAF family extracellular repeat protein